MQIIDRITLALVPLTARYTVKTYILGNNYRRSKQFKRLEISSRIRRGLISSIKKNVLEWAYKKRVEDNINIISVNMYWEQKQISIITKCGFLNCSEMSENHQI